MALRRRFRATLQGDTSISHFKAESSTSNPVLAAAGGDMGEVPKRTKNYQKRQTRTKKRSKRAREVPKTVPKDKHVPENASKEPETYQN